MTANLSENLATYSGVVGMFDILGYQNFVDNNSVEISARTILKIIASLENEVPQITAKAFYRETELIKQIINQIRCLVLSDTILLHLAERDSEMLTKLAQAGRFPQADAAEFLPFA